MTILIVAPVDDSDSHFRQRLDRCNRLCYTLLSSDFSYKSELRRNAATPGKEHTIGIENVGTYDQTEENYFERLNTPDGFSIVTFDHQHHQRDHRPQ